MLEVQQIIAPNENLHDPLTKMLDTAIVHRLNVGTTAKDSITAFCVLPELVQGFGGRFPYHFFVGSDGTVTQTLSLSKRGLHARAYNSHSVAIALRGDFRCQQPTSAQWTAAVLLTALLTRPQGWEILGHDEAPGGSRYPNKRCPGDYWPMMDFRDCVAEVAVNSADINNFWGKARCC